MKYLLYCLHSSLIISQNSATSFVWTQCYDCNVLQGCLLLHHISWMNVPGRNFHERFWSISDPLCLLCPCSTASRPPTLLPVAPFALKSHRCDTVYSSFSGCVILPWKYDTTGTFSMKNRLLCICCVRHLCYPLVNSTELNNLQFPVVYEPRSWSQTSN